VSSFLPEDPDAREDFIVARNAYHAYNRVRRLAEQHPDPRDPDHDEDFDYSYDPDFL
jgi:hypothetical protein